MSRFVGTIEGMASNEYHFITKWQVPGTCEEIATILGDVKALSTWWPSVYLDVIELTPGEAVTGLGRKVGLFTKGWLPYTLRWQFTVSESNHPHGFTLLPQGDFVGRGIWTLEQQGDTTLVVYDWKISAEKGMLKSLSGIMKPVFKANHLWAMARGEESLLLELRRRRAKTKAELDAVPAPPAPTFMWLVSDRKLATTATA